MADAYKEEYEKDATYHYPGYTPERDWSISPEERARLEKLRWPKKQQMDVVPVNPYVNKVVPIEEAEVPPLHERSRPEQKYIDMPNENLPEEPPPPGEEPQEDSSYDPGADRGRAPASIPKERPVEYGPRASVTKADIKSENTYLAGRLARSMAMMDKDDGGMFAREYGLRPEASGMSVVRGMASASDREAAMQGLMEDRTKTVLDEFKEVPGEILRGAIYRNLQSLEDYANALSDGQARYNFIDDFEDEESIVADLAEYVPLIAASFIPGSWVPKVIKSAATFTGSGRLIGMTAKELPRWGKWISHMATFNSLVAIKEMVKEDLDGAVPPEHKYGPIINWVGTHAKLPIYETDMERKLRHEAYKDGDLWHKFKDQFVANAPGDLLIEGAAFGLGQVLKMSLKSSKLLFKEIPLIKNLEQGVTTTEKSNIERLKGAAEKVEAGDEYVVLRNEIARGLEKLKGAKLTKAEKERKHYILLKYQKRLAEAQENRKAYDLKSYQDNLNVIQAAAENAMLHTRGYKKSVKSNLLVVHWDPERTAGEILGRKPQAVNVERVLRKAKEAEGVRLGGNKKAEDLMNKAEDILRNTDDWELVDGVPVKTKTKRMDILPKGAFAGVSRRKVAGVLQKVFHEADDTVENIDATTRIIKQYTGYLDDDMVKIMADPNYKGNIVGMLSVARHQTDAKIIRAVLGLDMSDVPRAYKLHDKVETFEQLRKTIDPENPNHEYLRALLDKQKAIADIHKKFASEAGASLQAVDAYKAKDAFFLGSSLGSKLEYLQKLDFEKRQEAMDFYESVAKAEFKAVDYQIYARNPAWDYLGMLDVSQRSALNNYLGDTALLATKVGNLFQTLKLGYKNARRYGAGPTYDDIREGFKAFGRMARAKGQSYEYWKQTWDDLTGVTRFKTLDEHHLETARWQRTAASAGEKAVNVATGWRFKLMEMIDMTTTAFNSPMITRDAIQKMTYADAKEAISYEESIQRTYETARRLREALLNPGSDDEFLARYHRLRHRENARLSYRVKLSDDETTSKTWIGALSRHIQKVGQRRGNDGAVMLTARHFANTRLLVFANTFLNIMDEGKKAFWDGMFLHHKKWVKRHKNFTREEQEKIFETEAAYVLAGMLVLADYVSDDIEYEPLRGNEDLTKVRQLGGLRTAPTHIKVGDSEIPSSVVGHTKIGMVQFKHAARGIQRLMAIKDTADTQGDVELSAAAYKAAVNFAMDVTPHNMVMNIAEGFAALDEQGEGQKLRRYFAKEVGALTEDSIPMAKDIRTWREGPFGDLKGKPVKGRTTDRRPSESLYPSLDAYNVLNKSIDYLGDRAKNAYGQKPWVKRNLFGMLVKTPSQATADEPGAGIQALQLFTSRFKGTRASRDMKYDDFMQFCQKYGMFGKGTGAVEREGLTQGGVKRFTFGAGSVRYLSVRKRQPGYSFGMDQVKQNETGSMGIAPHKRSMMLGMVGGYADVWEDFYNRVEKAKASGVAQPILQDTLEGRMKAFTELESVRSARRAQRELWRTFGGQEGEPMIDVMNRIATGPWFDVQPLLFDYLTSAKEYNNFYLGPAEDFESRRIEDQNLARIMAMSLFYEKSWELTRKIVSAVDPDFQDRSQALRHHENPELMERHREKRRQKRDTKIP